MKRVSAAVAAFALYAAVVVWLSWPLARHLTTHLPHVNFACDFDSLYGAWILAYETHALTKAPATVINPNIYYPAQHALFYGPSAFGALPFFAPVFLATGNPTLALNLTLLGCVALTAAALHLVVVRWTASHFAGFLAAWVFLTTRWTLWEWLPTAPYDAALQFFPVIILLATSTTHRTVGVLWLSILVALQCLTDPVYVAPAVVVPLGVLAVYRLARRDTRRAGLALLAALGVAFVVLLPSYVGVLQVRTQNPDLGRQTFWPAKAVLDASLTFGWGPFGAPCALAVPPAALLLIVVGAVVLAIRAATGRPHQSTKLWLHSAYWALLGTLMSMAPAARWGQATVPLPHARLLDWLGIRLYETIRVPSRLGVAGLMGLALLAGLAFAECVRSPHKRDRLPLAGLAWRGGVAALTAALMYVGLVSEQGLPLAWRRPGLPDAYPIVFAPAADIGLLAALRQGTGPVLELPAGDLSAAVNPASHARAMYRSIFHWRPLLNGYSSYWPASFPQHMDLANRLPDADALAILRAATGVDTVVVHARELNRFKLLAWFTLAKRGKGEGLRFVARYGDDLLFTASDSIPQDSG